jgi:hypothetical protein
MRWGAKTHERVKVAGDDKVGEVGGGGGGGGGDDDSVCE